ncbi:hypothetical protein SAMN05192566_0243 [Methylophilus rhizosphaerae]|uniref:Uncharacterized protein n=1 Tax=Methylophilus rhizosphaerae TaxID=492660 RepID=A0A1G8ZDE1_9PROT|nr:hypothetical protein SAMN05192566_0243 [Methylophilus rhizosphaerae]
MVEVFVYGLFDLYQTYSKHGKKNILTWWPNLQGKKNGAGNKKPAEQLVLKNPLLFFLIGRLRKEACMASLAVRSSFAHTNLMTGSQPSSCHDTYRITTPQGSFPTAISLSLVFVWVSITDTLSLRPLATYSFLPSGVSAIFHGRFPTATVAMMR